MEQLSQSTKKDLIENVEMKKPDQTAAIMKCMAGMLTKEELQQLLVENGYKKTDIKYIALQPDTLLYHTIQELQTKYGNPHITFQWPKFVGKEYDGHFSKRRNAIQINFPNMMTSAKNSKNQEMSFQGDMIDMRLSELSHKKQQITFKKKRKDFRTLIKLGFDYDEMYDTEGTIEYEAHEILQKEIINEFLETYANKINITNEQEVKKAEYFFEKYEYTKQPDPKHINLIFMLNKKEENKLKN